MLLINSLFLVIIRLSQMFAWISMQTSYLRLWYLVREYINLLGLCMARVLNPELLTWWRGSTSALSNQTHLHVSARTICVSYLCLFSKHDVWNHLFSYLLFKTLHLLIQRLCLLIYIFKLLGISYIIWRRDGLNPWKIKEELNASLTNRN